MHYKCLTANNDTTKKLFLRLPGDIYDKNTCPQNKTVERQILDGTHVLSSEFEVFPFVIIDSDNKPVCRCILTCYQDDPIGYVGFFESKDQQSAVDEMMVYVSRKAKDMGKTMLMGPVDSSIYIGYRFKIDRFDKTYTGEPYNKDTYFSMWKRSGFELSDMYISNHLLPITDDYQNEKMKKIYDRYIEKGYQIISPTPEILDECLREVYSLMMDSFSNFVGYKKITEQQFLDMFLGLGSIADLNMIKLAYDKEYDLKAFSIALPNYNDLLLGKLTIAKKMKIAKIKQSPSEYVVLYAGANKKVAGLGCAVSYATIEEMRKRSCSSIGALIHEGNMTGRIYDELYTDSFHYALLTKRLTPGGN